MHKETPLVSVIVPTYNRAESLKRAIKSVLEQTYTNLELLIIDDASTDNTEEVVDGFKDNRIKFIKLPRNTKGRETRNTGIIKSNGEFIAFLDSDDEWLPQKLERQVNYIIDLGLNKKNVMCFTSIILNEEQTKKIKKNKMYFNREDIMEYIFVGDNIVQTSTYLVSSNIAKKTMFNPNLKKHQDWDFCMRLRNNECSFVYLPECLTIWNRNNNEDRISNSYKNEGISLEWLKNNEVYLSKRAKWGFKVKVFVDDLILSGKKLKALQIITVSIFYKAISINTLLKKLIKIIIPGEFWSRYKQIFERTLAKIKK